MRFFSPEKLAVASVILGFPFLAAGRVVTSSTGLDISCDDAHCPESIIPRGPPIIFKPGGKPGTKPGDRSGGDSGGKPGGSRSGSGGLEVEPLGTGLGLGDIRPIGDYKDKGTQNLASLRQAITKDDPDTTIVSKDEDVHPPRSFYNLFMAELYEAQPTFGAKGSQHPELLNLLKKEDTGFEFAAHTSWTEYSIRSKHVSQAALQVNHGGYSRNGEFIIANTAFKDAIPYPKGHPQRIPNNEITWQCFAKVAKEKTKNLKGLILRDIQNRGTWKILREAYEKKGIPLNQKAVWKPDPNDPGMDGLFKTIVGSDNIAGKLLILQNHHKAIGNKEINKVITWTRHAEGSLNKLTVFVGLREKS
ncbi:hypothetical protein TRV_03473 [Trichophyton verrucosum HKI 0517]|uniref:Uncharacterized protein n=1 Tax=Trichophyton verrucosum (strain HKI 0517) TaxID=663202 RepID=D4D8N6_TRIVH|nr:uncharacterized protein TRV_03473 [Trichophyton verrucosum HKI 0517]EFE41791.1 hypothetical protein TRV_03473 [Trichophyton verrucosum HKI 0517]